MLSHSMVRPLIYPIKIAATLLIASALGLEATRCYLATVNYDLMANLPWLFYLERLVLMIHFIEAIIAGMIARIYVKKTSTTLQKSALYQGIYTFFVGTVGLMELWQQLVTKPEQN